MSSPSSVAAGAGPTRVGPAPPRYISNPDEARRRRLHPEAPRTPRSNHGACHRYAENNRRRTSSFDLDGIDTSFGKYSGGNERGTCCIAVARGVRGTPGCTLMGPAPWEAR